VPATFFATVIDSSVLTEKQHAILQQIIRSTTASQRLVQRARSIVPAFDGMFSRAIANAIGLQRKQVGLWRRRPKQSFDALAAIECRESQAALRRAIEEVLGDAPRSGSTGTFTAEQVTQVLAVACEPADRSGRPIDEWTGRELADELIHRGIVPSISTRQVNRYPAEAEPRKTRVSGVYRKRPLVVRNAGTDAQATALAEGIAGPTTGRAAPVPRPS
jgi:putative transposase